jgi:hypothetical protein
LIDFVARLICADRCLRRGSCRGLGGLRSCSSATDKRNHQQRKNRVQEFHPYTPFQHFFRICVASPPTDRLPRVRMRESVVDSSQWSNNAFVLLEYFGGTLACDRDPHEEHGKHPDFRMLKRRRSGFYRAFLRAILPASGTKRGRSTKARAAAIPSELPAPIFRWQK